MTPEQRDLILETLNELEKASSSQKHVIVNNYLSKAAKIYVELSKSDPECRSEAALLSLVYLIFGSADLSVRAAQGLREWYGLFYEEVQDDIGLQRLSGSPQCFDWRRLSYELALGFFTKAERTVHLHPVMGYSYDGASPQEQLQGQCFMQLLEMMKARPTVQYINTADSHADSVIVDEASFWPAIHHWLQTNCLPLRSFISENRLQMGLDFSGNMDDILNMFFGTMDAWRHFAGNNLELLISRLFHSLKAVSSPLQLRVLTEQILGKSVAHLSVWNPSLFLLLYAVLQFDAARIQEHLTLENARFSVFTTLSIGIVVGVRFEDHNRQSSSRPQALENKTFAHFCVEQFCKDINNIEDITSVLLNYPNMDRHSAKEILRDLDASSPELRESVLKFVESEEFRSGRCGRIERIGWIAEVQRLVGRAYFASDRLCLAAHSFKKAGLEDRENPALQQSLQRIREILQKDRDNFCRALKLEQLNTEELLSTGEERRRIWIDIKSLLKDIALDLEIQTNYKNSLDVSEIPQEVSEDDYSDCSLMRRLISLLNAFPTVNARIVMEHEALQQLQSHFQRVLQHPRLTEELQFLVSMKATYAVYLFGSQVAGYCIFEPEFLKTILSTISHQFNMKNSEAIERIDALDQIMLSIHNHLSCME